MKRYRKYACVVMGVLLLSVCCLCACGRGSDPASVSETPAAPPAATAGVVPDSVRGDPVRLVWITDKAWVDRLSGNRKEAVNRRIRELGYNIEVSFLGLDGMDLEEDGYDTYQNGISACKKEKKGDLMWTGAGDGEDETKEDTYVRHVREKNLLPLKKWLQSGEGKKLYDAYDKNIWDSITCGDEIYSVSNDTVRGFPTALVFNEEMAGKLDTEWKEKTEITLSDVCQFLEQYAQTDSPRLFLQWNYLRDYEDTFRGLGFFRITEGVYMNPDGGMENVWANELVCRFWKAAARIKEKGELYWDDSDVLTESAAGTYPVSIRTVSEEYSTSDTQFLEDGTTRKIRQYLFSIPMLDKMRNDVHGVTRWSRHKKEAKQLLMLVNTDPELSNLLAFGIENEDYELKDGRVHGAHYPLPYCPANPRLANYSLDEVKTEEDKAAYYARVNGKYALSPAAGFEPDLEAAGMTKELQRDVEDFYKVILDHPGEAGERIAEFRKELERRKYPRILASIQKQYKKWRRKKG